MIKRKIVICQKDDLYKGCILSSLAHAIMVSKYPELSYEQSWDGINYNVNDSHGTRGTLTFSNEVCIGAFYTLYENCIDIENTLASLPNHINRLFKEETLQYLLQEVDGFVKPFITTLFWEENGAIYSIHDHEIFKQNGGIVINDYTKSEADNIIRLQHYYDMSNEQANLLKRLYYRRINQGELSIKLTTEEISMLDIKSEEGRNECVESFGELRIYF